MLHYLLVKLEREAERERERERERDRERQTDRLTDRDRESYDCAVYILFIKL